MTIYQGSRYEYSTIDFFAVKPNGNENPVVFYSVPTIGTLAYRQYTWVNGDRMDLISYKFYGRADLFWYILDANPNIQDPNDIEPGTVLKIPNV